MKLRGMGVILFVLLFGAALLAGGCSGVPPCPTSLVTLDEARLDAETYEQENEETAKNAAELEKKLADKKGQIDQVKAKPAELKKMVDVLKKGSGRE